MKLVVEKILEAVKIYSPIEIFIVYFIPVFSMAVIGNYFGNPLVQKALYISKDLSSLGKVFTFLIIATFLGKFLSIFSTYVLTGVRLLFNWVGLVIFTLSKHLKHYTSIQHFRKSLQSFFAEAHEDTSESLAFYAYLQTHGDARIWYTKFALTTQALHTTFGALILLLFTQINKTPGFSFFLFCVMCLLLHASDKKLARAELEIQKG